MSIGPAFERLVRELKLDSAQVADRRRSFGLGDQEEADLRALHEPLGRVRDGFVRGFYDFLGRFEETAVLLEAPGTIERLAKAQAAYFERLTQGDYDLGYALDRLRVGVAHHRVGLGPRWYLGGFNRYLSALVPALSAATDGREGWIRAVRALVSIVLFDVSLALEAYQLERRHALTAGTVDEPALDAPPRVPVQSRVSEAEVSDVIRLMGLDRGDLARRRAFLGIPPGASGPPGGESGRLRAGVRTGLALLRPGGSLAGCLADQNRRLIELATLAFEEADGDPDRAALAFTASQREVLFDIGLTVEALSFSADRPLQEAREAARAVTRSLPSGLLTVDAELVVEGANPRACGILGQDESELVGLTLTAAVPSPLLAERAEQALRDDEPRVDLFLDLSGPPRQLLRVAVSPLAGDRAVGRRLLVVLDDVTGVTQLQKEVARSEQRFRSLLEGLDVAVCEMRPHPMTMTFVSPQVDRILGIPPDDWLRSMDAWMGGVHPEDRPALEAKLAALSEASPGETDIAVYRFDVPGRGEIWIQHRCQVTSDSAGRAVIRAVLLDITPSKEAELELRSERNFVRSLLDTAGAVVLVLDPAWRILEFNAAAEALYGRSRREVAGLDYLKTLLPDSERAGVSAELERLAQGGRTRGYENSVLTRRGEHRMVLWNADRLETDDGEITGVIAVGVDVTERREAEEELRRAHGELLRAHRSLASERSKVARAERLSSIGLLASGVAHEINNPLGGVIACVEALQRGTLSGARTGEYFDAVQDGLDRIRSTISGLLDYAKQRPASPEPLPLREVVESCVRLASPAVRKSAVAIELLIGDEAPRAYADRPQVMQGVLNILLNAVHAVGDEGVIRLSAPTRNGEVGVRVEDDGPGIPTSIVSRVCDPFFTTKAEGAGTGLGLAVTLGLAEANGGELEISSVEGEGCAVTIWLPVAEA